MIEITILGGALMLIYMKYNTKYWYLSINDDSIISEKMLNMINQIPNTLLLVYYYSIILLFIISIWNKNTNLKRMMYGIALIILTIGVKITISILSFENYTDLWIMIINHPIPIEIKQYYLLSELESIIRNSNPIIYMKPEILEWYKEKIKISKGIINNKDLYLKTPSEIKQYAYDIINTKETSPVIKIVSGMIVAAILSQIIL